MHVCAFEGTHKDMEEGGSAGPAWGAHRDLQQLGAQVAPLSSHPPRQPGQECQWCPPQPPTFTCLLHEAKEVIQELLAFWVLIQFVELGVGEREVSTAGTHGHARQRRPMPGSGPLPVPGSGITPGLTCPLSQQQEALCASWMGPPRAPSVLAAQSSPCAWGLVWTAHTPLTVLQPCCRNAASVSQFPCPLPC